MTTFLVVLATAELISQNRWVLVVISGVAVSGAYYLEPVDRSGALLVWLLLLQMVIAVSIGLLMLTSSKQIELLKQQVEYLAHRTNTELAVTLHDTVITDLTKALVMVRSLQVPNRDQPLYALADIEQSIARAITQLRRTVTMLQPRNDPMNESVSHALDDAARMLGTGTSTTAQRPSRRTRAVNASGCHATAIPGRFPQGSTDELREVCAC